MLFALELDKFVGNRVIELDSHPINILIELLFIGQFRPFAPGGANHIFVSVVFIGCYSKNVIARIGRNILIFGFVLLFNNDGPTDKIHYDIIALINLFGVSYLFRS